jgi:hypothetical protein
MIYKMPLLYLIICPLYTAAQLRQYHNQQVIVLQEHGLPFLLCFFVQYLLYYRVRIYGAAAALVNSFFQEYRVFFRLPDALGGYTDRLLPGFNFHNKLFCL